MASAPKEFVKFILNGQFSTFWISPRSIASMNKVITDQSKNKEKIK